MMRLTILTMLLLLCNACNPDKSKQIAKKALNFSTNDASELFFKNIRQSYYHTERKKGTNLKVYRHKDYDDCQEDQCRMKIVVVHNWQNDLAYALLELSDLHQEEMGDSLTVISTGDFRKDTFICDNSNIRNQLSFITDIYNELLQDKNLSYLTVNQEVPWDKREYEVFRVTCSDFYRLVNAYSP